MDIQPTEQNNQSISDDQELAKVLAGVTQAADDTGSEEAALPAPEPAVPPAPAPDAAATDAAAPVVEATEEPALPAEPVVPPAAAELPSDLESIKQAALGELRPLVDKLDVTPEEKFDTYLLLLRSTDDRDLIAPAHEAAKAIADETRKAQALLDIIKEIDYLTNPQPATQ